MSETLQFLITQFIIAFMYLGFRHKINPVCSRIVISSCGVFVLLLLFVYPEFLKSKSYIGMMLYKAFVDLYICVALLKYANSKFSEKVAFVFFCFFAWNILYVIFTYVFKTLLVHNNYEIISWSLNLILIYIALPGVNYGKRLILGISAYWPRGVFNRKILFPSSSISKETHK